MVSQINSYKTSDGKIFENFKDATDHEKSLEEREIENFKMAYVREKLKKCCYAELFIDKFGSRKSNIEPDRPLVYSLIRDTKLIKEIIETLDKIDENKIINDELKIN